MARGVVERWQSARGERPELEMCASLKHCILAERRWAPQLESRIAHVDCGDSRVWSSLNINHVLIALDGAYLGKCYDT